MASILAVDDSISMRQMMKITFQVSGHDVITAEDGLSALGIARTTVFDLVITDLRMPKMDGITLIGELRKLPGMRHRPMFMLTTESADDRKQAAREAGASGWIIKPVSAQQLRHLVERVLADDAGSGV
ncbi:MAG: response regulator [Gammaproteobacteria bacterium]|nr:response regulator [Gammaproteobacteria bacterium]